MKKIIIIAFIFLLSSCYLGRVIVWNFADIKDYKKFPSNPVEHKEPVFRFYEKNPNCQLNLPEEFTTENKKQSFEKYLEKNKTVAFLVIRNDTLLYENYFRNYSPSSIVPSFSINKSFISALIGIAISEGYIKSVQQPVTDFIPELLNTDSLYKKVTIENLMQMRSGIKFSESYFNPFSSVARMYYGRDLKKFILKFGIKNEPDKEFEYVTLNVILLGIILERATGKKPSKYLEEKIWQPLGMEYDASWSKDNNENGTEGGNINARPIDYAKLGRLYLNKGNWNGKQIIPKNWVEKTTVITKESKQWFYSYLWWQNEKYVGFGDSLKIDSNEVAKIVEIRNINKKEKPIKFKVVPNDGYWAEGLFGQYIFIYPEKNMIFIRFGKKYGHKYWDNLFLKIANEN